MVPPNEAEMYDIAPLFSSSSFIDIIGNGKTLEFFQEIRQQKLERFLARLNEGSGTDNVVSVSEHPRPQESATNLQMKPARSKSDQKFIEGCF